ncbi:unnamed protein product [Acanthosepion pharaonis]|uniref:Uncharacterized protein n=1 Tax=Acanthosepion pharaonis TaxID=158019 RepID=A0A812CR69_ACAPH|nr:unnamed protein product [Sepia pharaonis]
MKKMHRPDSKCCSVFDISKDLLPLYEVVDLAYLEILVTKHLSSFGNHWDTMMALTSLDHGKLNSTQDGSSRPFVLFGINASKKSIQNLSTVNAGTLGNSGENGKPAILMVCQVVSPCFPVSCCRTYFFQNEPFIYNEKPQEAEEKAREILQENKTSLNDENLKKHLDRRDNILFVLESMSTSKTKLNKLSSGSDMKKIQMSIWDIPCKERKCNSTYGSLAFGETFVLSSIKTEDANDGNNCRNNEVLVITSNIPRYHCWRTIPVGDNIEETCKTLMLTDDFGKLLFDSSTVDIIVRNKQCNFSSTGHLYVFEKGIIILRSLQDPICLPNSRTISLETYYKDAFSSLALLFHGKCITTDQANVLPTNFANSAGNLVIVFKPETKARRVFFSQLLHYWRKSGQVTHVDEVEPELQEIYNHLSNCFFFRLSGQHSIYEILVQSNLLPVLLKKWPKWSTATEETDNKVIITIISGIRGSHKEKVSKVLSSLSKEHNRWMILNDSLEETRSFDDVKLQNYLSTSIMAQRKNFHETEGHPDKELRVIIIVPGYAETMDVVRAILTHPNSQIREQIKIGAVTVCVNPDNCFLENRFIFPILMNQCATGWVNNVLFITSRNNDNLLNEIQLLIRSANPQVSFLRAHKGKFQSYDFDLILSDTAFDSPALCRARNLLYPNCGFPFHKNVYNVRGQVLFSGDKQMSMFHYITLSNQLDVEIATLVPTPPKPSPQKEKLSARYFVIFSGCHLDKGDLKTWLRPCFKNIPEKKSLLNRKDLSAQIIKKVQDKHRLDSLPAGWYYNGQQYVCLTGERSTQHPYLDEFLDKYTETTNAEINKFNAEIDKEQKRFVFL